MQWFTTIEIVLFECLIFLLGIESNTDQVQLFLQQGSIVTSKTTLQNGVSFYAFKNIPFAEPPVGNLRFKNPMPAQAWSGVRDGTIEAPICPQLDLVALFVGQIVTKGNEDCLYLEVWTPKPESTAPLPVMVWIHGGAFSLGSAPEYMPVYLMTKDVVVVVIQYRLGTLGFMSTEDEVMPGNYGLKDQVMALRWVKENIRSFGGDPDSVTIFGESAGGISVHYHMVSPMSKGLFHRAISQSGTALIPNLVREDHRDRAMDVGNLLQCPGLDNSVFDSQALWNCLKDIPVETLTPIANAFAEFQTSPQVMTPSIDGEFFPEHPIKMVLDGNYQKVDFMAGINQNEGSLATRPLLPNPLAVNSLAVNFSKNGPLQLSLDPYDESEVYSAKRMFYHYVGDITLSEEKADDAEKMFGDWYFNIPFDQSVKQHAKDAASGVNTYIYEFRHNGEYSVLDSPFITFGKEWVGHSDEIPFLFNTTIVPGSIQEPNSLFISDMMVDMWTNFAATGDPTPDMSLGFKWDPISESDLRYLIIELSPYMTQIDREESVDFLLNLPTQHNKRFFPERFEPRKQTVSLLQYIFGHKDFN